jgi:hypothetical protein
MTIQQTTPHLGLPLPHPDNDLETDVVRLRDALTQVDGAVFSLRALVASDDVNLDTVQEVVTVLKQAQGSIGSVTELLALKANKSDVAAGLMLKADTAYVSEQLALKATAAYVDAQLAIKANSDTVSAAMNDISNALFYSSF